MNNRLNIIVTGGSRGLGRSLVHELVTRGHRVVYTTRRQINNVIVINHPIQPSTNVLAVQCDVSCASDVAALFVRASEFFPSGERLHAVIHNAAVSGGYGTLVDMSDETLSDIVNTNLLGTLLCCKYSCLATATRNDAKGSTKPAHVFLVVGAGSDGSATPCFAPYGSTKAAVMQLSRSLRDESKNSKNPRCNARIHTISPGMMPTPLLLNNLPSDVERCVKMFCAPPEDVASWSIDNVTRIIATDSRDKSSHHLQYFTPARAIKTIFTNMIKTRP